ncbi:hypothetical protein EMPS_00704 [Entomortierella parvispora]|uniref:Superoxide dismutase copper/zinc binding domain-containing protein n=1 Tax=Entomortierella parvispora TaxID=205924 RepID=A0A9P3H1E3_9FUNG|nr:hypothetical protein EMPS_00704 [Entomortierella parvispora]
MVFNFRVAVVSCVVALAAAAFVQADTAPPAAVQEAVIDMGTKNRASLSLSLSLSHVFSLLIQLISSISAVLTGGVQATFTFAPLADSPVGATVTVVTRKLPSPAPEAGFEYHIHVNPVGPNNDCGATGGHLDPTNVGMATTCDPDTPEKCQEGDLSGKHGNLMPEDLPEGDVVVYVDVLTYVDHQLQFSGEDTTIVGRSVVVHSNGTRIACANLVPSACHKSTLESVDSKKTKTTLEGPQTGEKEEDGENEDEVEGGEEGIHVRTKLDLGLSFPVTALRGLRSRRRLR